jgi:hypothetical protein
MYETKIVKDGDPAFGIDGTFQIHDHIYPMTDDADDALLMHLTDLGYRVEDSKDNGYTAKLVHKTTKAEILGDAFEQAGAARNNHSTFFVSFNYLNKPKIPLNFSKVHDLIIAHSSRPSNLDYYNRPNDQMSDVAISRMSGFVKNMVDVDYDRWEIFLNQATYYHAQDFIRYMAFWASQNSDKTPRPVRIDTYGDAEVIPANGKFIFRRPNPMGGYGRRFGP